MFLLPPKSAGNKTQFVGNKAQFVGNKHNIALLLNREPILQRNPEMPSMCRSQIDCT